MCELIFPLGRTDAGCSNTVTRTLGRGIGRRIGAVAAIVAGLLAAPVFAAADLGIAIVTSNPTPTAGGAAFSYTLTVTNNGPDAALGIVVNDAMPPGVIFHNVSIVNNPSTPGYGLTCVGPPTGTNGTVTCTGSLPGAAPSVSTITIVAQMVANIASGVRTNTATVASDTQEASPNTLPNTASIQQNIVVDAPLSITKAGPAVFVRGSNVVYQITVLNGGSSTALNATISDSLPANMQFVSMFGTGTFHDGCTVNPNNTVTCAAVDIPTGIQQLTIVAKSSPNMPLGSLGNTAQITTAGTGTIAVGTSTTTATVNP